MSTRFAFATMPLVAMPLDIFFSEICMPAQVLDEATGIDPCGIAVGAIFQMQRCPRANIRTRSKNRKVRASLCCDEVDGRRRANTRCRSRCDAIGLQGCFDAHLEQETTKGWNLVGRPSPVLVRFIVSWERIGLPFVTIRTV